MAVSDERSEGRGVTELVLPCRIRLLLLISREGKNRDTFAGTGAAMRGSLHIGNKCLMLLYLDCWKVGNRGGHDVRRERRAQRSREAGELIA